jgi:HK97 family phage prohead protease
MQHHNFSLKVKSVDDSGKFTGIGAVYGNVDLGGDKILPGAFSRTLAGSKQFPLLWQHSPSDPIGSVKVTDSPVGLQVEGQLLLSDPTAQKAYSFLKAGVIRGLSIGFETVKASFVDEVRELSELKLWELSVVTGGCFVKETNRAFMFGGFENFPGQNGNFAIVRFWCGAPTKGG